MTDASCGEGCSIDPGATVGYEYSDDAAPAELGDEVTVRSGTIVYRDVTLGTGTQTGHNALVREMTNVGTDCLVGTGTVIDGRTEIGDSVSLQTGVYVPSHTQIGERVFVGPRAVLTNDPYPVRRDVDLEGPTIEDAASIGANATILPGITVGAGSFVAAGAVVTEDVPPETLAIGAPATFKPLPEQLQGENDL